MIGKNEQTTNVVDHTRVKTITDKRKTLEDNSAEIRAKVTTCFSQLSNSLKIREKQLLRQIEAVHNQQLSIIQSNWELLPSVPMINVNLDNWQNLEDIIFKFGRIELPDKDGIVVKDAEPYRVEEYEEANKDHVSFDKSIQLEKDTDIVINLSKKFNLNTNVNTTITDLPSSSSDTSFNVSLEAEKFDEIGNNNCSPLCSPLLDSSVDTIETSNLRTDSLKNLCSSHTATTDTSNQTTAIELTLDPEENSANYEDKISKCLSESLNTEDSVEVTLDNDLSKISESTNNNEKWETDEHPKQIQQWLEQILVETETEPAVHEIEQFAEISKSRYREFEFPLKT